MPTYDYKCKDCDDTFEHFQRMTDEPLGVCNKCGGKLVRLIGTGLTPVFKGSGFYQTDYKKNNSSGSKISKTKKSVSEKSDKVSTEKKPEKKKSA
ncbi:MAG: zinc ribbon domain-containing protein [Bacteroidota bacterium]